MEIKNCPYCGGEILKTAKKCKHCGEWIEKQSQPPSGENVEISNSNTKIIILWIIGGIALAFILWLIFGSNHKSNRGESGYEYYDEHEYDEFEYRDLGEPIETYSYDRETNDSYYYTDPYDLNSDANSWD